MLEEIAMNEASKEFNTLASLIIESANEVQDNFKLNLFPQYNTTSASTKVAG
jgi:hypothetical protein